MGFMDFRGCLSTKFVFQNNFGGWRKTTAQELAVQRAIFPKKTNKPVNKAWLPKRPKDSWKTLLLSYHSCHGAFLKFQIKMYTSQYQFLRRFQGPKKPFVIPNGRFRASTPHLYFPSLNQGPGVSKESHLLPTHGYQNEKPQSPT